MFETILSLITNIAMKAPVIIAGITDVTMELATNASWQEKLAAILTGIDDLTNDVVNHVSPPPPPTTPKS